MFLVEWFIEVIIHTSCGWLGHHFVRLITFGKVELDYGDSSESNLAEVIGAGLILAGFIVVAVWLSNGS